MIGDLDHLLNTYSVVISDDLIMLMNKDRKNNNESIAA